MNPHEGMAKTSDEDGDREARPAFRRTVHPGTVLGEELATLGVSLAAFARQVGVERSDVTRIIRGQRAVTASRALRFGHWFGTGPEFWLNLQAQYDLVLAEQESGEAVRRMPTKETPLPPQRRTGRPPKRKEPLDDREVYLAHELPTEWVAELEEPVPPYETALDDVSKEAGAGAEARERARRAAQTMDEMSRGLTLDGLSLQELIGRNRS